MWECFIFCKSFNFFEKWTISCSRYGKIWICLSSRTRQVTPKKEWRHGVVKKTSKKPHVSTHKKSPICTIWNQACLSLISIRKRVTKIRFIHKGPYPSGKEPPVSTNEPYLSTIEPYLYFIWPILPQAFIVGVPYISTKTLYIHKRAIFICAYLQKSPIHPQNPWISAKELHVYTKAPSTSAKEPYIFAKKFCGSVKETYIFYKIALSMFHWSDAWYVRTHEPYI